MNREQQLASSTKEQQGKLWSVAPHFWSRYFEPFFAPVYKETLQNLSLSENTKLLDAGCGSGLFISMAKMTGADVTGIDAAEGLLKVARKRNPQQTFIEDGLESLPFEGASFNVVTGFNSFQYTSEFAASLAEARRVLEPGGKLVICIWDDPAKCDAFAVLKELSSMLPTTVDKKQSPFALSAEGAVEQVLASLQLKLQYRASVPCPFLYYSLEDGIRSFLGTGPAAAALKHCSESVVQRTISTALRPFHLTDNFYHLQNSFLLFIAEK